MTVALLSATSAGMSREERQRRAVKVLREVSVAANLLATTLEQTHAPDEAELQRLGAKADALTDELMDSVVLLKGQV